MITDAAPRAAVDTAALRRFLDERTDRDPDALVFVADLYAAWLTWAHEQRVFTMGVNTFTRDVVKAAPDVRPYRPRASDGRKLPRSYRGLVLR